MPEVPHPEELPFSVEPEIEQGISAQSEKQEPEKYPPTTKFLSRRKFLKIVGGAFIGAATADTILRGGGYDKASQILYEHFGKENYTESLAKVIEALKPLFPTIDQWVNSQEWAEAIHEACDKNKLEPTIENLAILLTLIIAESGFRTSPRIVDLWLTPSENTLESTGLLEPKTSGPMELSNRYIMADENISYEEALEKSSTVKGGIFYGTKHVKMLLDTYAEKSDSHETILRSFFADYNAGAFASRNAGLQRAINEVSGSTLREDGLLLLPKNEQGELPQTQSITALENLFAHEKFNITHDQLIADLQSQLSRDLEKTETWKVVKQLYAKEIPLVPADRPVLGFLGFAKKRISGINTSREYSEERMKEFVQILEVMGTVEDPADQSE